MTAPTRYIGPQRAHDAHSICPWCGAHSSYCCEFGGGVPCPWEEGGEEDAPRPVTATIEEPGND